LSDNLGSIAADPGQLEQVIVNLVVNARDAIPRRGRITIETFNITLTEGDLADHPETYPGNYVLLSVSDAGIGMDEATKSKIFEPFFTTKEKGKGTGFGLSTVYGIVKQSGGSIYVHGDLGKGTTFKLCFPRVDQPAMQLADDRPLKVSSSVAGKRSYLLTTIKPCEMFSLQFFVCTVIANCCQ
jgi:two-component system cell cycle sensor histidine kinase/response regulator CckA